MAWTLTSDLAEYEAAAGGFLRSRPAGHTVFLGAMEILRTRGMAAFGDGQPLFGWWATPGGGARGQPGAVAPGAVAPAAVTAAFLHTPPFGAVLTAMPPGAAASLAEALAARGRRLAGVQADTGTAWAFAERWQARTGEPARLRLSSRLYALGRLRVPDPLPPGRPRAAADSDRDLLVAWLGAFQRESASGPGPDPGRVVDEHLSYGGMTLWERDGAPVSLAGLHRPVAGQVRVGPVYTPPERRRRGYGGAATAAVTRAALDAGARQVLLFTDLANPTSNALYQRLGYRPVSDRVVLAFA